MTKPKGFGYSFIEEARKIAKRFFMDNPTAIEFERGFLPGEKAYLRAKGNKILVSRVVFPPPPSEINLEVDSNLIGLVGAIHVWDNSWGAYMMSFVTDGFVVLSKEEMKDLRAEAFQVFNQVWES